MPPFFGANEAQQAACANMFMDGVTALGAEIDGKSVQNLGLYRTQSPQYTFSLPVNNYLGLPGPATGTSVSVGFYLLLSRR